MGPSVITISNSRVIDITTSAAPTLRDICEKTNPVAYVKDVALEGLDVGSIDEI